MSIEVKLNVFEGPLDLLLQLIDKNKVDIYDIPIALIADQYMAYVNSIRNEDLDTLCDFLVMASTLLEIKAKMLLPKDETEEGETEDPRSELVQRLIEYKEYKMCAAQMKEQYQAAAETFYKDPSIPQEVREYEPAPDLEEMFRNVDLNRLQQVFRMVMERREDRIDPVRSKFGNIKKDPVRLSDKLLSVMDYGQEKKKFLFADMMALQETRTDMVVTFLACLELIRIGRLTADQDSPFGDIRLEWNENCDNEITKEDMRAYD